MWNRILITFVLFIVAGVQASSDSSGMDFGDACALILGLGLGTIGILACLGKYARSVSAGQF